MQSVSSNAVAGAIANISNYSSTPVTIGKWIDGSTDVKRVTLNITFSLNESLTTVQLSNYNINEVVCLDGIISTVINNTTRFNFNINSMWDWGSGGWKVQWYINTGDKTMIIQRGNEFYSRTCYGYITIDYV